MTRRPNDGFYTIYHIKGFKIGCTKNVQRRKDFYESQLGYRPRFYVLERVPIDTPEKTVAMIERAWIDKHGYHRGVPYDRALVGVRKAASKGGAVGGFVTMSKQKRSEVVQAAVKKMARMRRLGQWDEALAKIPFEERSARSKQMHAEGVLGFFKEGLAKCPHCKKTGHMAILKAWHFDRCKKNPAISSKARKKAVKQMSFHKQGTCKHCGAVMSLASLGRYHNDQCKFK